MPWKYCHQKGYIIAAITNNFIRDLFRNNQTVAWLIICYFFNIHTALTFIRGIIAYIAFCLTISIWFFCNIHALALWEFRFTFRFRSGSFKLRPQQPWFIPTEIPGISPELCGWSFNFSNQWWSWSICNNSLTISSSLPLLYTFIACCSRLPSFLFHFSAKCLTMSIRSIIVACLPFSSSFSKSIVSWSEPSSL